MDKKFVAWLYDQLPDLVAKGILSAAAAENIRNHYGPLEEKKPWSKRALITFSMIGVFLVALGIILILAHNWDHLGRGSRLLIALAILLAAQLSSGYTLLQKSDLLAWREGCSIFLFLSFGASIALVGQTYHIVDNAGAFLLTWMLLSSPLAYLFSATSPAILYLIGITVWVTSSISTPAEKHLIWLLLAIPFPYYWCLLQKNRFANPTVLLGWAFSLCGYLCFWSAAGPYFLHFGWLISNALFTLYLLCGALWFGDAPRIWQNPLQLTGYCGLIPVLFGFTFNGAWESFSRQAAQTSVTEYLLFGILLFACLGLLLVLYKRTPPHHTLFALSPLVLALAYSLQAGYSSGNPAAIVVSIYLFFLSITVIMRGLRNMEIGRLNAGMVLLAALILARFFDTSFSFIAKGLVFTLLGLCFLLSNWWLLRRKSEVNQ